MGVLLGLSLVLKFSHFSKKHLLNCLRFLTVPLTITNGEYRALCGGSIKLAVYKKKDIHKTLKNINNSKKH